MKLSYEDKVQIYELRKQGYSLEKLSNKFEINNSNLRYMIKLIDRYGIEFVKDGMVVGLGTGSTAYYFVEEIGRRIKEEGLQITAVTTSSVTSKQAEGLNIPLK